MNYSIRMAIADNEALIALDAEQEIEFKSALLPASSAAMRLAGCRPIHCFYYTEEVVDRPFGRSKAH